MRELAPMDVFEVAVGGALAGVEVESDPDAGVREKEDSTKTIE